MKNGREAFEKIREEVLREWPTGKEVDFREACDYLSSLPPHQFFHHRLAHAKSAGRTLVQPRAGVALISEHIQLLKTLEEKGGADLLPITADSYTRNHQFDKARKGIEESLAKGRSLLNGFPVVNHGVKGCREVVAAVNSPVGLRCAAVDKRLAAEIALAGGLTCVVNSAIVHCLAHSKKADPETAVRQTQYTHRLMAEYQKRGLMVQVDLGGAMSTVLVPPGMALAIMILEALLAAGEGVKSMTVGFPQSGCLSQDVIGLKLLEELCGRYLQEAGFGDVEYFTAFQTWVGRFPEDRVRALGVISVAALTAAWGGAQLLMSKSADQGVALPSAEDNAAGVRICKQVIGMARMQKWPFGDEMKEEADMIAEEVAAIVSTTLGLGDGDVATGIPKAIQAGAIELPFVPNAHNQGLMMPVRDHTGAIRYLDFGHVPVTARVKEWNAERLSRRLADSKDREGYELVISDVMAIGRGDLVGMGKEM